MSLKIGLFTLQSLEELNIDTTDVAIYIANYIAGSEDLTVAIIEPKNVIEPIFKTAKASFLDDGTFFVNRVHYYPAETESVPMEDIQIYDFREINILHEFNDDFQKLYICTDASQDALINAKEYLYDTKTSADAVLIGGSKEKLAIYTSAGIKSVNIADRKEARCPHNFVLQLDFVLRSNNIEPPEYHKDWTYEDVVFHYIPEPEPEDTKQKKGVSGFFGLLKNGKPKKQESKLETESSENKMSDNEQLPNQTIEDSGVEVLEHKPVRKSNAFEHITFTDVPAPGIPKPTETTPEEITENAESLKQKTESVASVKKVNEGNNVIPVSNLSSSNQTTPEAKIDSERENALKEAAKFRIEKEEETKRLEAELKKQKELEDAFKQKETEAAIAAEELRKENEQLRYNATHDKLTGMKNRMGYEEDFKQLDDFVLIAFDVNDLKRANDKFGHTTGDKLLTTVSDEIHKRFENVYRMGGDEFNVLIPNGSRSDTSSIMQKLKEIDDALEAHTKNSTTITYRVAYGVAYSDEGTKKTVSDLADDRMYEDKKQKKQKYASAEENKTEQESSVTKVSEPEKKSEERKGIMSFLSTKKEKTETESKQSRLPKFGPVRGTLRNGRLSVFVTGLRHSCGTSYIAGSIASAMTDIYNQDVWFDHKGGAILPDNIMVKEVRDDVDRFNAFKSGIIVQDKGLYEDLSMNDRNDLMRADLNIMVCTAEDSDLRNLAEFIDIQRESAHSWLYVFNHVKKSQEKMVRSAMADYPHIIIKFHDNAEVPQDIQKEWLAAINHFAR